MKLTHLSPDDPKLTAYALGELDPAEAAEVASAIADDAAAQSTVDEIRTLAAQLQEALENEPILAPVVPMEPVASSRSNVFVRFPLYWASGLAAACLLVILASKQSAPTETVNPADDVSSRSRAPAAKQDLAAPIILPDADINRPVLPVVDNRRRTVPMGSDVNPAPLKDDGLKLGRTVAANASVNSSPAGTQLAQGETLSGTKGSAATEMGVGQSSSNSISRGSVVLQASTGSSSRVASEHSPARDFGLVRPVANAPALAYSRESRSYQPAQGFLGVAGFPLSSLSASVATESYTHVRDSLQTGRLPAPDAVRVEEMLNYFSYGYSGPRDGNALAASLEVAAAPWNPSHRLVRIGLKGRESSTETGGPALAVANDVRLEVEFNPDQAKSYRLIGYENGASKQPETTVASITGSEVDAGRVVTALYEVVPVSPAELPALQGDPLRYESESGHLASDDPRRRELLTVKIRYKLPTIDVSRKIELPLIDTGAGFAVASKDFKFAAAVASFGMLLKESPHKGSATYDTILTWAEDGQDTKEDPAGARHEFMDLVKKAKNATVE